VERVERVEKVKISKENTPTNNQNTHFKKTRLYTRNER